MKAKEVRGFSKLITGLEEAKERNRDKVKHTDST